MTRLLIVEDQPGIARALQLLFEVHGVPSEVVTNPAAALGLVAREQIGVVVQDMNFRPDATDGEEGRRLFLQLRELDPELPVVLITAWTSLETAVELVRAGAADYVAKPWDDEKLVATVRNLLALRELALENRALRERAERRRLDLDARHDLGGFVYRSEAIHDLLELALRVARSDAPVLITGPAGTGKEKLADVVHANSPRRDRPFVKLNVAALPEALIESELFGAERGAYTGQDKARPGRFEIADGGTLLLDEIGLLPPSGQAKLLRVLQSGEVARLGSPRPRTVDVRVLAATNVDLHEAIAEGTFREDLYFRLNVVELPIPPLAERPDDVLPLAEHFLRAAGAEAGRDLRLRPDAAEALVRHEWAGNVRELENRVRRAAILASEDEVGAEQLGLAARATPTARDADDAERAEIERVLVEVDGNVSEVARRLGMSRPALYRRMSRLGIVLERRPRE